MDEQMSNSREVEKRKHDAIQGENSQPVKKHRSSKVSLEAISMKEGAPITTPAKKGWLKQHPSKPTVDKKERVSPLLALPVELRDEIYKLAVRQDTQCEEFMGASDAYRKYRQPGLCMVSKQIRAETLPMFYGINKFEAVVFGKKLCCRLFVEIIPAWLNAIGPLNCTLIKRFVIKVMEHEQNSLAREQRQENAWRTKLHNRLGSAIAAFKVEYQVEFEWLSVEDFDKWISGDGFEVGQSYNGSAVEWEYELRRREYWCYAEDEYGSGGDDGMDSEEDSGESSEDDTEEESGESSEDGAESDSEEDVEENLS